MTERRCEGLSLRRLQLRGGFGLAVTLESKSRNVGMLQGRSEREGEADKQEGLVGVSQLLGTARERFERSKEELRNHTKVLMA